MKITEIDFENLATNSMRWDGTDWQVQADRFADDIRYDWAMGYWFDDITALIMAKNFLNDKDIPFQESYDEGSESYLVVTNYETASWAAETVGA
jgi:hypothetical protein